MNKLLSSRLTSITLDFDSIRFGGFQRLNIESSHQYVHDDWKDLAGTAIRQARGAVVKLRPDCGWQDEATYMHLQRWGVRDVRA